MPKVLYVCPSSGIGGAETFIKQIEKFNNRELFENHYLLFCKGPLYDELQNRGANLHLLPKKPRLSVSKHRKSVAISIQKIIDNHGISLVHSTMAYAALFSARICKKRNVKHVWFQHGPASGWMDRLAAILPHQALITNSHFTAQKQRALEAPLRHFIPRIFPVEKILLGTDIEPPQVQETQDFTTNIQKQFSIPEDSFIISMLARIQPWKGAHILLEAIKQLKTEDLPPFYCLIWGEAFKNSTYFNQLNKKIMDMNLPARLAGPTDRADLALGFADCIVNASTQPEPFGLSIIEGMALGTVPIVPNEGGPIEIVSHGKTGMTFQPQDPSSLAKCLKTIINDKNLYNLLSAETRKDAKNKFHAQRAISHLETFHLKVINS